jgi:acyl-CoA thioesterase FadM
MPPGASITIEQRLEWVDTDASGHHHFNAMFRMAAVAEAELLERLGMLDDLRSLVRVHLSLNLRAPITFRERVDVELKVAEVGRTSVAFCFTITSQGATAADGRVVAVRMGHDGRPAPWPDDKRAMLLESGDITAR